MINLDNLEIKTIPATDHIRSMAMAGFVDSLKKKENLSRWLCSGLR